MRTFGLKLLILSGSLVVGCGAFFIYHLLSPKDVLSIESPNGNLLVIVSKASRYTLPLGDRKFVATVVNRIDGSENSFPLAVSDWFDADFSSTYLEPVWENNRVLRFERKESTEKPRTDLVGIRNISNRTVPSLRISALDMLLVFNVAPDETIWLEVPHYKWQTWIEADGIFNKGRPLRSAVNFFHQDRYPSPNKYCITVSKNEIRVQSLFIEGWNHDQPPTPIAKTCS